MKDIVIDEEFKSLLPALDKKTFELLEENILENGCRDSIVLWGDILVDGHNRYEICMKHDIPFNTVNRDFDTREDALIWIISTQISRRNLTQKQLSNYRGLHYAADKKKQGIYNHYSPKSEKPHNEVFQKSTAGRLAEQYNVSRATIERDAKFAAALNAIGEFSPEAKRLILTDKVRLDKKEVSALSDRPGYEIEALAMAIEEGTYKKKAPERHKADEGSPAGSFPVFPGPGESGHAGLMSTDTAVYRIADDFVYYASLRNLVNQYDTTELKKALRFFIDMLEDVHGQL